MDTQQVREIINQLVESDYDRPQARRRLTRFSTENELPREPTEFPNLQAFLDFHEEKRRYEDRLRSLHDEAENLDKAHEEAEDALRGILPANVPLNYDYEGGRQELAGFSFKIVNQHLGRGRSTIIISSTRAPSQ